jgi:lactate dehydrogenase-like 2-hydroxyacid dehydrogenase
MKYLEDQFTLFCNPKDRALCRDEMLQMVKGREGLLPLLTDRIDDQVMEAAGPQLKIISNYAVGFNNIDLAAASSRGILVTNTPGVLTDTTADLTMALILALSRRLVEGDRYARSGQFKEWSPLLLLGADVHHKTLGIFGLGRIGLAVAKRALGFDMRILYHNTKQTDPAVAEQVKAHYVDKETLLKEADFVSVHVPLNPSTVHFISTLEFGQMKPTAFLINTARGEVVDEQALVEALKHKRIAGAGLDVFEKEPHIHPDLLPLNNVVLLPHIGSASLETRTRMGMMAADNLRAAFQGLLPPNCLNPEVFERDIFPQH